MKKIILNYKKDKINGQLYMNEKDLSKRVVIICHGVNNDKNHPFILMIFNLCNRMGTSVLRFDFSFVTQKVDPENLKIEDLNSDLDRAVDFVQRKGFKKIIFIGKSAGGVAAMNWVVSNSATSKVIILGYPMSLIEKKFNNQLRILKKQLIIVQGKHDPFCDMKILKRLYADSGFSLEIIEGLNHSFKTDDGESKYSLIEEIIKRNLLKND